MGKSVDDTVIDAALDMIATCTLLSVCDDASTPTDGNFTASTLASVALTAGDGNGDYVIANGSSSGRKITIAEQADVAITTSGDAQHIVLSVGGAIKLTTTCTTQALTSGGTVTIPTFIDEIADPA